MPDDQASQESNSPVFLTPSTSRASSPTPINTDDKDDRDLTIPTLIAAPGAADINSLSRADIDLWSADVADLTMRLARYDEYNPPSVQPETRDAQVERAQGMFYYRKCQDLTNLLRRSQQLLRDSATALSTEPDLITAMAEQRWAEEQIRAQLEHALAHAQDTLSSERERADTFRMHLGEATLQCTAVKDQLQEQVDLNETLIKEIVALENSASKAEALIKKLSVALRVQNWALSTMVEEIETMRDNHHQMLDDIMGAFDVDYQTGTEMVQAWGAIVTELLLMYCRFDPDTGGVREILDMVDEREAARRPEESAEDV